MSDKPLARRKVTPIPKGGTRRKRAKTAKPEKAKDTAVLRKLAPIAREINVRLDKASKIEKQADDHRVAAAIKLAEAHTMCRENKIVFRAWCEGNVHYSYDEARKLAQVGNQPDPKAALQRRCTALSLEFADAMPPVPSLATPILATGLCLKTT